MRLLELCVCLSVCTQQAVYFYQPDGRGPCLCVCVGWGSRGAWGGGGGCVHVCVCVRVYVCACTHSLCACLSVATQQAVYFYQPDGRGPCLAFEGEKLQLHWFRGYLIVVGKESKSMPRAPPM